MNSIRLEEISRYLDSEVGFFPIRTKIAKIPKKNWSDFCLLNGWKLNCHGAFSAKTLTTYIEEGDKFEDLNIIHEFFGHGLFFEYHPLGKFLRKSEQRGNGEIKRYLHEKSECLSELFAIWCELYYGTLNGLEEEFKKKYSFDNRSEIKENLCELEKVRNRFGLFGMFAMLGFPKYYDGAKIKTLMEKIYGKEKIESSKLGILYGSKRPYSDIDLFIISGDIKDFDNEWLDIFSKTPDEFEKNLKLFAISLRDPLLKGELIFGNQEYFNWAKSKWLNQPITDEAIRFNAQKHSEMKRRMKEFPEDSKSYAITQKYAETYLQNALSLKLGRRFF